MRQRLARVLGMCLLVAVAAPAAGQTWKFDLGVNGGGSWWSELEDRHGSSFETSWLVGTQATAWFWPRAGLRLNLAYEDRALEAGDAALFTGADPRSLDHINIWGSSLDLLLRLKRPAENFVRGEWLPYLALGGGIRNVNPAGDLYRTFDLPNSKHWTGVPYGAAGATTDTVFLGELWSPLGLVALGTDWRLAQRVALRLEIGDRLSKPRVHDVLPRAGGLLFDAVNGEDPISKLAHEIYGTLGLHLTFGGAGPAPVVVTQAPPPPPPAPTPTQPRAAPREEAVTICVIDPAAAEGVRLVSATFLPETRDTVVMVSGQRTAFRTTVPQVQLAAGSDWLVAGRPLEVTVTPGPARFLPVGQTRTFGAGSLVLLGRVNGLNVYADRSAVTAADRFGTTVELAEVLRNAELRRSFDTVQTLYVPYSTVGCGFQPLQRQEEVRKSR